MAAPATTARGTPAGIKLRDGYPTKIAPASIATVSFWEKDVGLPGVDGGDGIPQTTMHNATWRTFAARALLTLDEFTVTVAYDPAVYAQIVSLTNKNQSWTTTLPDGTTIDYFAFMKSFKPKAVKEGEQPEADITIMPTNYDPANNVEQGPVVTSVSGT